MSRSSQWQPQHLHLSILFVCPGRDGGPREAFRYLWSLTFTHHGTRWMYLPVARTNTIVWWSVVFIPRRFDVLYS
jgi:hypothetical protein